VTLTGVGVVLGIFFFGRYYGFCNRVAAAQTDKFRQYLALMLLSIAAVGFIGYTYNWRVGDGVPVRMFFFFPAMFSAQYLGAEFAHRADQERKLGPLSDAPLAHN